MERQIINKLIKWKEYPFRRPLILTGIRQVGKTWTLKEFGRLHYDNTAYFNFGENENYKQFFEGTKDIKRMLQNLMMASGQRIEPERTLVIFDEIQDSPQVLKALEYFCDNGKEYHIVCAGNLFKSDMTADSEMLPMDKVEILELYPMNFKEFLRANGDDNLAALIENINILEPIAEAFYNSLLEKLKMYFITGGMPQSVLSWTQDRDVPAMETALKNIIEGYESDFVKKAEGKDASKMLQIWQSIPLQLSKNNRKFTYKGVKEGARAREYEGALNCMTDLGTVKKVYKVDVPEMPLSGKEISSSFKIYLPDVGILRKMYQMTSAAFGEGDRLFAEFNGAISEGYLLEALMPQFEKMPRYWSTNNPFHKVDFIVEYDGELVPIEVSGTAGGQSKSLKKYKELFPDKTPLTVRFSLDNLKLDRDKLNVPLFMADEAARLIGLALDFGKGLSLLDIL